MPLRVGYEQSGNDAYLEKALSGMVIFFVNKIIFPEGEANKAN